MKTYLDTNILYYALSGKKQDINIKGQHITSIIALEFLKNIEKEHTNRAKFHIPRTNSIFYYKLFLHANKYFRKRKRPLNKKYSDFVIFDFSQDYESYALYNNESIAQVINNKNNDLLNLSISFLEKSEIKDIKSRFGLIIDNDLQCESIDENDINLAYELLVRFIKIYSLKEDFRNCWNDILIISKVINEGGRLITTDKLLNKFASELYNGSIIAKDGVVEIEFPNELKRLEIVSNQESKGFINRGWNYKIKRGN